MSGHPFTLKHFRIAVIHRDIFGFDFFHVVRFEKRTQIVWLGSANATSSPCSPPILIEIFVGNICHIDVRMGPKSLTSTFEEKNRENGRQDLFLNEGPRI